ncbi:cytochrome P450 [Pluteus cervinus]|uniref:Cytochrome P450 n=1 Tax=Pluteus cervinus TaxID=181527 RepID=A0ACD3AFM3_9AGAR|nr:cytochrome P450 [Pluteus cervinus]
MSTSTFVGFAALLVALFVWFRKPSKASSSTPLPPGPKPLPVLGNVRDLTAKELWLPATQWGKDFGDVVYLHVFGQGLVFLNSPEAVFDLLDKRGSIYSDKPQLIMICDLCGCKNMVAFTGYNEQSKRHRKLMHQAFAPKVINTYHPLMISETHDFLRRLIADPSGYMAHTRRYSGGLTLSVVYGYEAAPHDDKFLAMAEETVDLLANRIASGGGIWPVDILPFLQYLPLWAPGAGFLRNAAKWKATLEECVEKPYEYLKESMKSGNYTQSFCSMLLDENKATEEFEFDLKWVANSMYASSMDTVITTIAHFLLAMMHNPEALAKAQKEIDTVVGSDRLPDFNDRSSLPYVDAIFSETLRWGVPVPLNLPHRLMEDDVYNGKFIPKGSLVFGNIWAIVRDERIYPKASEFIPERFLEEVDEATARRRDPRNYVFGFGRRQCPGNYLVESSIWLLMASMLATLKISKPVDEEGNVIEPKVEFKNPVFRIPTPFKCDIRPRSEAVLNVIRQNTA